MNLTSLDYIRKDVTDNLQQLNVAFHLPLRLHACHNITVVQTICANRLPIYCPNVANFNVTNSN